MCKPCEVVAAVAWRRNNVSRARANEDRYRAKDPKRTLDQNRRSNLKRKYGLSLEDWKQMHIDQGNVCAVCRRPADATKKLPQHRVLQVDHCHDTGKIRGLLCVECNTALGKLNHDTDTLARAITYLNGDSQ